MPIDEKALERQITQLSGLKYFKKLSKEKQREIAKEKLYLRDPDLNVIDLFTDTEEKKYARELLKKYLKNYVIDTISSKNDLKHLLYLEVIQQRLQNKLNFFKDDNNAIPKDLVRIIHENLEQITRQKEKIGLFDKKEQASIFDYIQQLKNKFKIYLRENQGSRTLNCPHCGKMCLLRIRTDKYDVQTHPFFRDRVLTNDHLVKLFFENKLTKDDLAKILETSTDYIDWLVDKWYKNREREENGKQTSAT